MKTVVKHKAEGTQNKFRYFMYRRKDLNSNNEWKIEKYPM